MNVGIIGPRVLIRRALSIFLVSTGVAHVVVEGENLYECRNEITRSHAEILIVDLDGQGFETVADFRTLGIEARIVVLMDDLDGASYARALQLGIWGCLSTKQSPMVLRKAVNCVARGEQWKPQHSATNGLLVMRGQGSANHEGLTPRELKVLGLMANGFNNSKISTRLHVSQETVRSHIKSIYRKLKVEARQDAISRYFEVIRSGESKVRAGHDS